MVGPFDDAAPIRSYKLGPPARRYPGVIGAEPIARLGVREGEPRRVASRDPPSPWLSWARAGIFAEHILTNLSAHKAERPSDATRPDEQVKRTISTEEIADYHGLRPTLSTEDGGMSPAINPLTLLPLHV
jgi:hypothetical protein